MVDWGLVAVIIALLAYPFQAFATPQFLDLSWQAYTRLYCWLWPPARQCNALEWTSFREGKLHTHVDWVPLCPERDCQEPDKAVQRLFSGVWEQSLNLLFPLAWDERGKVPKPNRLSATVQYTRTDSTVLLMYAYFSAMLLRHGKHQHFEELVQLREQHGMLIAQMRSPNSTEPSKYTTMHNKLRSATKEQMETILFDNRQEYPNKLRNSIANPIRSQDDWRRGGWIVAIGISCTGWDSGAPFLRPVQRSEMEHSAFCYGRNVKDSTWMVLPPNVNTALLRVIHTFRDLSSAFHENQDLVDALAMTECFRTNASDYLAYDTIFRMALERSPLFKREGSPWCMKHSSAEDRDFAVDLFNTRRNLSNDEQERLRPILREVCRAALVGMICVLRFYDRREFIEEPSLLKKYRYVYLEDSLRIQL